jgi:hypothetical protein
MQRGHVKLWRKSLDSGLIQNPNLWTFWTWCLLRASWKERDCVFNMQVVKLEPGQFIFGRKAASDELMMTQQVIRTCLKKLKTMQKLTIKTTNRYSIISIVKWDTYQQQQPADNQQVNQQLTSSQPTTNQQLTTNKNSKELNNGKELKKEQRLISFNKFWELYDKKVDKDATLKLWLKLKESDIESIFQKINNYIKATPDKKFRKGPARYLRQRSWEDEIIKTDNGGLKKNGFSEPGYYGESTPPNEYF